MDLELSEEQKLIKETVRRFLEKEIQPLVDDYEKSGRPVTREIVKKLVPFGFLGGLLPEEAGGAGLSHTTYFLMIEELSRVSPSLRATVGITNSVLTHIYEYGTEDQKERFLGRLLSGDSIGFSAITEPNVGSDTSSIETTAVLRGEQWILNGTKMFITNGVEGDIGVVIPYRYVKRDRWHWRFYSGEGKIGIQSQANRKNGDSELPFRRTGFRGLCGAKGKFTGKHRRRTPPGVEVFEQCPGYGGLYCRRNSPGVYRCFGKACPKPGSVRQAHRRFSAHSGQNQRHGYTYQRHAAAGTPGQRHARQRQALQERGIHGKALCH